jgi:2,3-bisphosphoglycerate-dependent phosphoglycerate mutase
MPTLALVRHGQSLWNLENRFTGWTDVPLTRVGEDEARDAGERLRHAGLTFDIAYTSVLVRAQETLRLIQETAGYDLPVIRDSRR